MLDERNFPLETLDEIFKYHAPTSDQVIRYGEVREAAKHFVTVLVENCPSSSDLTDAVRKVREAVMTANASIALEVARK